MGKEYLSGKFVGKVENLAKVVKLGVNGRKSGVESGKSGADSGGRGVCYVSGMFWLPWLSSETTEDDLDSEEELLLLL